MGLMPDETIFIAGEKRQLLRGIKQQFFIKTSVQDYGSRFFL